MRTLPDNLVGAGFMTLSMAGFALEDMCLKTAAGQMPVGQVLMVWGVLGTLFFSLLALSRGEPILHRDMFSRPMILRAGFEGSARMFYTLAIALIPLSDASAIMQATPIVVVAGAALFLREKVGWRRWLAILIGFVGVLMILRPGTAGFTAATLLAIAGMAGFAGRDLATRAAPRTLSNAQIGICGFSILLPTGFVLLAFSGGATVPDGTSILTLFFGAFFGLGAYMALTEAMRTGEVSFVTPFRYTRILFGVGLGMIAFGERPDVMSYAGAGVILLSGLYIMFRQNRVT
ncbi:DMT family transporter [Tropicimonas sp. TH_r6]|uniref:DMT family transporter n=1 Tax=Tropicimonas sp. TH_r6 TaxID=3082085 RepID=UPI002954E588|nr:DMT family transporter [Tropicimonas sp. TH_r6]MDV7143800.1 DMT family transporter [Tropicimonas sp. TH_r6]